MRVRSGVGLVLFGVLSVLAACGGSDSSAPEDTPDATSDATSAPTSTSSPGADASGRDGAPDGAVTPLRDAAQDAPIADAGRDSAPTVPPLVVPTGTWTYVPIPGMVCGNGSATGIAVNPDPDPTAPIFFLMMGGGACWDDVTCLGGAASNLSDQIDEPAIRADIARFPVLFDRARADNAFKRAHYVFVPYCTGDLHAGDARKTYRFLTKSQTIEHRGARNVEAFLPSVASTFRGSQKVILGGGSAGGFGTMLSYHRFRAAFPSTRIDILNDSGTPVQPTGSIWQDMQSSWNMSIPAGCTNCAADVRGFLPFLASEMGPNARFALLSFTQDRTIRAFTGVGLVLPQQYESAVLELRTRFGARQKSFLVSGDPHVIITKDPLPSTSQGLSGVTWLQRFANDDPAWDNAGP